jgi:hypothetical protein
MLRAILPLLQHVFMTRCLVKHNHVVIHSAPYPMDNGSFSPGVKWPVHEGEYSSLSNAEVKNAWIYTFILPHVFIAW